MGALFSARWAEAIALASTLGFQFAIAAGSGCAMGYAVDWLLGWKPVAFTILGGLLGFAAGLRWMVRSLDRFERRRGRNGKAG